MFRTPVSVSPVRRFPRAGCFALMLLAAGLTACGEPKTELGQGGSKVSGSAGPAGAQGQARELVTCDQPVATLALAENPDGYMVRADYRLPPSPVPLIKLMAQQSGCFRVMDRGGGLHGIEQEQALKEKGILGQEGSLRRGVGISAQYTLTPSLTFSEQDAGRGIAGILSQIPGLARFAGLAENVRFKEAQVLLLLSDNETTEQVAAATGSARATDVGDFGMLLGGVAGGIGAGWSNTNEGKLIAAAFLDAHNKLVTQARTMAQRNLPAAVATRPTGPATPGAARPHP